MAQKTSTERLEEGKKIIPGRFVTNLKTFIHPLLVKAAQSKIGYKMIKRTDYTGKMKEFSPNGRPIIFACNHTTSFDVPIAFTAIGEHAILFAGKQTLEPIDEMFFNLNGTVYVDRKDKADMVLSKRALVEMLKQKNVLTFPNGTWDMTDSKLSPDLKWGIIDVAKEANALIVPMALFYDYEERTCKYTFGKPIDVTSMSKKEGIDCVQDAIGTMMWNFVEDGMVERGLDVIPRETIDVERERGFIRHSQEEYPKLDVEYEKSVVFNPKPTHEEVFAPVKKLTPNRNNAFLFDKRLKG